MTLKSLLWKLGLLSNNCPYCGKKLIAHGFEPNQRWTCLTNNCEFNKQEKNENEEPREKIGLGELIVMLPITALRGIALIFLIPIVKVLEFLNRWRI